VSRWRNGHWLRRHRLLLLWTALLSTATLSLWSSVEWPASPLLAQMLFLALFFATTVALCRVSWVLVSLALSQCTQQGRWFQSQRLIFYSDHSGPYLWWSLLSVVGNAMFLCLVHFPESHPFGRVVTAAGTSLIDAVARSLQCALVLTLGLFLKTLLIRWICLKYYLAANLCKIKKMVRCEKWLKILLKQRPIFSMKTKQFLDINAVETRNATTATTTLRLDVLLFPFSASSFKTASQRTPRRWPSLRCLAAMSSLSFSTLCTSFSCSAPSRSATRCLSTERVSPSAKYT